MPLGMGFAPPTDSTRPSLICATPPQKIGAGGGHVLPGKGDRIKEIRSRVDAVRLRRAEQQHLPRVQ